MGSTKLSGRGRDGQFFEAAWAAQPLTAISAMSRSRGPLVCLGNKALSGENNLHAWPSSKSRSVKDFLRLWPLSGPADSRCVAHKAGDLLVVYLLVRQALVPFL